MPNTRAERIQGVAQAIAGLERDDLLLWDDFMSLMKPLIAKWGTKNVSDSELDRELDRLLYYYEPTPG